MSDILTRGTRGCGGRWLGLLVRGRVPGVLVAEPGYHPGDVKIPESVHEEDKVVFLNRFYTKKYCLQIKIYYKRVLLDLKRVLGDLKPLGSKTC